MAIGLAAVKWAQTIITITVIGTDKNIPNTPQIAPHKPKAIKITKGLKFKDLPNKRGSKKLPTTNWMAIIPQVISKNGAQFWNWTKAKAVGKAVAIIAPILGIKFKKKFV